jgi:hypothetical protein
MLIYLVVALYIAINLIYVINLNMKSMNLFIVK